MSGEEAQSNEQRAAEAQVEEHRNEQSPFVIAAETTRMPMLFLNAGANNNRPIIFANDSLLELTGYDRSELLAKDLSFLIADQDEQIVLAVFETLFSDTSARDREICCRRKDGNLFWASAFINPVCDEHGDVMQYFVSLADLTKHRRESDRLRFLFNELNHRTQNMLAVVQAIAGQTLRGKTDATIYQGFERRLLALSDVHSLLARANWGQLGLRDMIEQVLQPWGSNGQPDSRYNITGENIPMQPKTALSLAMVMHELASNAVKYGALSNDDGQLDINWRIVEPDPLGCYIRLHWQESGGPTVIAPDHKGFGMRLIEQGLAQDLDAQVRVDYPPTGLVCEISLPVPLTLD